jgi:hypothetical protein
MPVMKRIFQRALPIATIVAMMLIAVGCGGSLSGKYDAELGVTSVVFTPSKAVVITGLTTVEVDYEVLGDKVILKTPMGNMVLTRNNDGTLDGPFGKLTRSKS